MSRCQLFSLANLLPVRNLKSAQELGDRIADELFAYRGPQHDVLDKLEDSINEAALGGDETPVAVGVIE